MSLNKLEKSQRKLFRKPPPAVTTREMLVTFLVCLITAPFLYSALFMIPLIGQGLFLGAFCLTLIYFYVRRSLKIILSVVLANLIFIIPTLIVLQLVTVKNRFDVTIFILIASCIPVSIFYILIVAGLSWHFVESRQEAGQQTQNA